MVEDAEQKLGMSACEVVERLMLAELGVALTTQPRDHILGRRQSRPALPKLLNPPTHRLHLPHELRDISADQHTFENCFVFALGVLSESWSAESHGVTRKVLPEADFEVAIRVMVALSGRIK